LDRKLDGSQSWSGWYWEVKIFQQNSNPEPSVVQPVASRYTEYLLW
jgi:hypothetical protein